jgi:hypothetical protein
MDASIVKAAEFNDLPQVMALHQDSISLDSLDVSTAIATPMISLN